MGFLLNSERQMEAECIHCDGRQYGLVERHGRTAKLAAIANSIPCLFCRREGVKVFEVG